MCGLILSIRVTSDDDQQRELHDRHNIILHSLNAIAAKRGPDSQNTFVHILPLAPGRSIEVTICGSVLGLRGEGIFKQPMVGKRGVLAWNGQVFSGLDIDVGENDTRKVFEKLEDGFDVQEVLSSIEGPYAFIYLDLLTQLVHFQLDPLSRRSLLLHQPTESSSIQTFLLASIRSEEARKSGLEMRALLGGEGGQINLSRILMGTKGTVEWSHSVSMRTQCNAAEEKRIWTSVTPINYAIPSPEVSSDQAESSSQAEIQNFIHHLGKSVRLRVENIPQPSKGQSRLAILFSGGIDCTFLAFLADRCLPESEAVDLINVAFERSPIQPVFKSNRRPPSPGDFKGTSKGKERATHGMRYDVPDRITGREAYEELQHVCPNRDWRFVEVNIGFEECQSRRQEVIDAMYPSATEMDLSLAFPLFFASRGVGVIRSDTTGIYEPYTVRAKVYISGLGADEQLGGYARHRNAYKRGGWQGLIDETQMDISRLPTRNLSRDDRIISSHARDARYPYLDLSFIAYLSCLPIHVKCDLRLEEGQGDKRLLRLATRSVGLIKTAGRVKRAMQFGTRSSKMGIKQGRGPRAGEQLVT